MEPTTCQQIAWFAEGVFKAALPLFFVFLALHIYHRR